MWGCGLNVMMLRGVFVVVWVVLIIEWWFRWMLLKLFMVIVVLWVFSGKVF